jgi:hypothetical protein
MKYQEPSVDPEYPECASGEIIEAEWRSRSLGIRDGVRITLATMKFSKDKALTYAALSYLYNPDAKTIRELSKEANVSRMKLHREIQKLRDLNLCFDGTRFTGDEDE